MANWFEKLPSVNDLLEAAPLKSLLETVGRQQVVQETARFLDRVRTEAEAAARRVMPLTPAELAQRVARWINTSSGHAPQEIINATGTFFVPELDCGPLPQEATDAFSLLSHTWVDAPGWHDAVASLLQKQLNVEAALVLNSGSAALSVAALSASGGRPLLLARGELERDPLEPSLADVASSLALSLREVGSVNQTTLADFEADAPAAGALLISLPRWTHAALHSVRPAPAELAALARRNGIPLLMDLGWLGLHDMTRHGWPGIANARSAIAAGAELIVFRGQGLLGGPPCGIVAGRRQWIDRIRLQPLSRLVTASGATHAALAAALRLYDQPETAVKSIPLLLMLETGLENLQQRAERLAPQIAACNGIATAEALATSAPIHAGQSPEHRLPSWAMRVRAKELSPAELQSRLRSTSPGVLAEADETGVIINLRTVLPREDISLVEAFAALFPAEAGPQTAS